LVVSTRKPTEPVIELSLEDEDALLARGKPRLPAGAYNPYDVDPRAAKPVAGGGGNGVDHLRKLSEWIKLKREVEELKAAEAQPAAQAPKIRSTKK
jgi:hypothetical protein